MGNNNYFQFPLCALAFCDSERERLDEIISFAFVDAGFAMFKKVAPEIRKSLGDDLKGRQGTPADYRKHDSDHVAAMLGAREIGINVGGVAHSLATWRKLSEARNQFQAQHGRDVEVRIRSELVFEARDKNGISYREFSILCAIYSCIGAKKYPVRITREQIQRRMLGYKTQSVMQAEIGKRIDGAKPLTTRQINYTLDRLDERQFFARARANKRQTYYSHRLSQEQLEEKLVAGKSYAQSFHKRRRQRDAELMARIKSAKSGMK